MSDTKCWKCGSSNIRIINDNDYYSNPDTECLDCGSWGFEEKI